MEIFGRYTFMFCHLCFQLGNDLLPRFRRFVVRKLIYNHYYDALREVSCLGFLCYLQHGTTRT